VLSLLGGAMLAAQTPNAPDLVLHNARIYTVNANHDIASALAIAGDRIAIVGSDAEVLRLKAPSTRLVDLRGATVVPGLHDAHGHVVGLGASMQNLDLRHTRSYEEVVGLVRRRVAAARPGEWILGRAWDQNDWATTDFPVHDLLSAVSPRNPVYLTRVDGHAALVNRRAMEIGGLSRGTRDPDGGRLIRTASGDPTGVLVDTAQLLVSAHIPATPSSQLEEQILLADREASRLGLTTVHDAGASPDVVEAYIRLVSQRRIETRLYVMLRGSLAELTPAFERGPVTDVVNHHLAVRAIKIVADGALGSRGAALLEPYADAPDQNGLLTTAPGEVYAQTLAASRAGFQTAVHAIGDRANRLVLDVFERVQRDVPGARALRMRIEHAQILDAIDIPRLARLGVIASMQPTHATSDMAWAVTRVGDARIAQGAYAWRAMLDSGVVIAAGSDFPVEEADPMLGLYAAITRQDAGGNPPAGWTPSQRMSRQEALDAFTRGAAYASHAESLTGSLEAGKLADLVVLSKDVMRVPAREILTTTVRQTMVGGKVVYERPGP